MLAVDTATDLTIRPRFGLSVRSYLAGIVGAGLVGLGLAGRQVLRDLGALTTVGAAVALSGACLVVLSATNAARGRIRVRGDLVTRVGWTGTTRFRLTRARGVRKLSLTLSSGALYPVFVVVDGEGRCLLALSGRAWRDGDLDAFTVRLGLQVARWEQAAPFGVVREVCPAGGLPFMIAHPFWFGLLVTPVVVAGLLLVVWLLDH